MIAKEAVHLLVNGIIPAPLDYNIRHTEKIDFHKLEYNNIANQIYENKYYKRLLKLPIFKDVVDKHIEELEKSGVTLAHAIMYDI
jgi:hypothetical protein